jgi:hypothetical protein
VNTSTTSSADTTFLTCSPPLDYIQLADDLSNHVVCLVNDVVELDVCDGPHWSSDVLAIRDQIQKIKKVSHLQNNSKVW